MWIALILIAISSVLAVIGCVLLDYFPYAAAVLGIIAIVLLALGLALFVLWWAICRFFTACSVIIAALHFMGVLVSIFFVVGVILGLIARFGGKPDMYLCMGVSFFQSGIWGVLLYILYRIAVAVRCITENGSGPPPPSGSSSSGLGSGPGSGRPDRFGVSDVESTRHGRLGLGDIVTMTTSAMGIQPCEDCHKRAARLNALVSFGAGRSSTSGTAVDLQDRDAPAKLM